MNKLDSSKIRLVNVDPAGKVIATLEKRTDALLGSIDAQSFQIEAKGVKTSMLSYDDLGVRLVGLTVVSHEDTIKSNPDLVRRFVLATRRAFEAAIADPQAAVRAAMKVKPELDPVALKQQMDASLSKFESPSTKGLPMGMASEVDWKSTLELLTEFQGIKTDRPATSFFTNNRLINLTRGEIIDFLHTSRNESLVMAQIEISLGPIIGDEYLTVLERTHRSGIHIDVRV